jgi:RNA polymerase sigma factor (sigma-70 family)
MDQGGQVEQVGSLGTTIPLRDLGPRRPRQPKRAWWKNHTRPRASDLPSLRRSRLATIYGRELQNVTRRLEVLGVPSEDLVDIAHDVFLAVMEQPIRGIRKWRELPGQLTRRTYSAARADRAARLSTDALGREAHAVCDPGEAPDEIYDLTRMIQRALNALDERFREVLTLYVMQGRRQRDIARELGMPPAAVHQLVQDGRYKFRCRLEKEMHRE